MINITNQNQLLITRDGSIDWDYTNEQIRQERLEALQTAGRELVHNVAIQSFNALKWAGKGLIQACDEFVNSAQ